MTNHRVKSALKHPPAWVAALIFLVVALAVGYYLNVGDVIWVVAVGGAVCILLIGSRNNSRS